MERLYRNVLLVVALISCAVLVSACTGEQSTGESEPPLQIPTTGTSPPPTAPVIGPPSSGTGTGVAPSPPVTLSLLGHTDLGAGGYTGNVRSLGRYAYVGSWGSGRCPASGVRIVDLADPSAPAVVAIAAQYAGTSAEDVVPLHVDTAVFSGDLLTVGIQRCASSSGAPSGLALIDITDPTLPRELGFFPTGRLSRGVHELDVVKQGNRLLALLAAPRSTATFDSDLRMVDITDPVRPQQVAAWGPALAGLDTSGQGCMRSVYAHGVSGSRDGKRAYVSFWDAGAIVLDIGDPASPRYLGRAIDPETEGAVHSAVEADGGVLITTEEDDVFRSPRGLTLRVRNGEEQVEVQGCLGFGEREIDDIGPLEAPLVAVGSLCSAGGNTFDGAIVLAPSGGCSLSENMARARAGRARALITVSSDATVESVYLERDGSLPQITISSRDGEALARLAGGRSMVTLPVTRPWGGTHIWDIRDPEAPRLLSALRIPEADAFPPPGPGVFTVHNPLVFGRYLLFSWYAAGVRVFDFSDGATPVEVASWTPPAKADPQRTFATAPDVWGVAVNGDLVLVSDINGGLYVLRARGMDEVRGRRP